MAVVVTTRETAITISLQNYTRRSRSRWYLLIAPADWSGWLFRRSAPRRRSSRLAVLWDSHPRSTGILLPDFAINEEMTPSSRTPGARLGKENHSTSSRCAHAEFAPVF